MEVKERVLTWEVGAVNVFLEVMLAQGMWRRGEVCLTRALGPTARLQCGRSFGQLGCDLGANP